MKIQLKRSSVLDGGAAKQPLADQLEYGELAVNYASADPTIFLKDSANNVIQIAGANALTQVPTLEQVTDEGNWSSSGFLAGGAPSTPNLQLNSTGNVISIGYYEANKGTNTAEAFKATLDGTETFKVIANGGVALGGTIDTTTSQSQANIFLNADTGNIRSITGNTTGTFTSGGKLTVSADGADITGTVDINNSLNVTEGTALTGDVTMGNKLSVTGETTLATVTATTYNLGVLSALPE